HWGAQQDGLDYERGPGPGRRRQGRAQSAQASSRSPVSKTSSQTRTKSMKFLITLALLTASLFMVGCKTASPLLPPAALTGEVASLTQIGLDVYPAAGPEVALARDVICGAASVTNVDPAAIVRDLSTLTTTNAETKIIVDGAMFL